MSWAVSAAGDRRIEARFERFPEKLRGALRDEITAIIAELEARVISAEPVRTGKLRAETQAFVDDRKDFIRGRVRVITSGKGDGAKVAALEYGAHALSPVRAHARTIAHIYGRLVAPRQIIVSAYSRQLDLPAHQFLRGPLAEMRGEIMERLKRAVETAESSV